MNIIDEKDIAFLPAGDSLKPFLKQPFLTPSFLRKILRQRGVFISKLDKEYSIPELTKGYITPIEYEVLLAQYELKEDNPKNLTESINGWLSDKELINCIPADFDIQSLMNLDCTNYEIIGSPSFTTLNGDQNQIIIKVEIERHDLTNTWDQQIKRFEGSLVLQKDINGNRLNLTTTYTSQETKDVIQSISQALQVSFKKNNYVEKDSKLERILISDFTNKQRFEYFLSITKGASIIFLTFIENINAKIARDSDIEPSEKINWLGNNIKTLDLSGNNLDNTLFFEADVQDTIILYGLDSRFKFSIDGCDGECIISLGYQSYNNDKAELEANIKKIKFDQKNITDRKRKEVSLSILRGTSYDRLDKYKNIFERKG